LLVWDTKKHVVECFLIRNLQKVFIFKFLIKKLKLEQSSFLSSIADYSIKNRLNHAIIFDVE